MLCLLIFAFVPVAAAAPSGGGSSASPTLSANDRQASLLGGVGVTTVSGTDPISLITFPSRTPIAGPYEAGFDSEIDTLLEWLGCSTPSLGYLGGGVNTKDAQAMVAYQCGVTLPRMNGSTYVGLTHSCGVHSPPDSSGCTSPPGTCTSPVYHFHQYLSCLYNVSGVVAAGHSIKVGTSSATKVTAYALYGPYESTNTLATGLDACGGHFGKTPESPNADVYHHHVQDKPPFTYGCYGPNADGGLVTVAQCRSYYSSCGDSSLIVNITTASGTKQYNKWCPCYDSTGSNVVASTTSLSSKVTGGLASTASTTAQVSALTLAISGLFLAARLFQL